MAKEYINKEVEKILARQDIETSLKQAYISAFLLASYKAENLKVFDMRETSSLCDYHILATANNPTQARSMMDELRRIYRDYKITTRTLEGDESADWILLDTGDVITHVFQLATRDVFDLDQVLLKNRQVQIPEEYYYSNADVEEERDNLKGYF